MQKISKIKILNANHWRNKRAIIQGLMGIKDKRGRCNGHRIKEQ